MNAVFLSVLGSIVLAGFSWGVLTLSIMELRFGTDRTTVWHRRLF